MRPRSKTNLGSREYEITWCAIKNQLACQGLPTSGLNLFFSLDQNLIKNDHAYSKNNKKLAYLYFWQRLSYELKCLKTKSRKTHD